MSRSQKNELSLSIVKAEYQAMAHASSRGYGNAPYSMNLVSLFRRPCPCVSQTHQACQDQLSCTS